MGFTELLVWSAPREERRYRLHRLYPHLRLDLPQRRDELFDEIKKLEDQGERPGAWLLQPFLTEEKDFSFPTDVGTFISGRYLPAVWHSHAYFEIIYVVEGTCTNHFHFGEVPLKKGDFCFIPPETGHAISVFDGDALVINIVVRSSNFISTFSNVLAGDNLLSGFFKNALLSSPDNSYLMFRTGEDAALRDKVEEMTDEFGADGLLRRQMLNTLFMQLIISLLRNHDDNIVFRSGSNSESATIYPILRHIRTHFRDISLSDLADRFGYSHRHMGRIIKDNTGQTFTSLISDIKLQEATRLLADEKCTVQQAAQQAGYTNIGSFHKMFREKYGVTPASYQKSVLSAKGTGL